MRSCTHALACEAARLPIEIGVRKVRRHPSHHVDLHLKGVWDEVNYAYAYVYAYAHMHVCYLHLKGVWDEVGDEERGCFAPLLPDELAEDASELLLACERAHL